MLVRYADVPWAALALRPSGRKRNVVRFWDLAAAEARSSNPDPDWTAGALLGLAQGEWYLLDVRRIRASPAKVEDFLWRTHELDDEWLGFEVPVRVEMEGGSGGPMTIDQLERNRFVGCDFIGRRPDGSKVDRATPVSVAAERGHFHLLQAAWNETMLGEFETFPDGTHDDQVDAVSGAFAELKPKQKSSTPSGDRFGISRSAPTPD